MRRLFRNRYTAGIDFRRQNLTSKVYPAEVNVKPAWLYSTTVLLSAFIKQQRQHERFHSIDSLSKSVVLVGR